MCVDRQHTRRDLLCGLGVAVVGSLAGCTATQAPTVEVPASALTDERVRVVVGGVPSDASLRLRASARSETGETWTARARFDVDDGRVAVAQAAPVDGTYTGTDPMGLIWSMRPAQASQPLPPSTVFVPGDAYEVTLTAEVGGEPVAEATTTRRLFDPDVDQRAVDRDDLVGTFVAPPADEPAPGVVHLHGAGGEPHLPTARLLASRGFPTLALQYFGAPDPVPDTLAEVPVAYVQRAMDWLREQPEVADTAVGLVGYSRGGSLALLAASQFDAVGAVVGWVPSGVVWEGLGRDRTPAGTSAWTVDGDPVPYLELADAAPGPPPTPGLPYFEPALREASETALADATIPVEDADAPIHLVSATDDRRWPSTALSERAIARLDAVDYPHAYGHDRYEGAGHYLTLPYLPTAGLDRDRYNVYGGTPAATARASEGVWRTTLSVLRTAFGG